MKQEEVEKVLNTIWRHIKYVDGYHSQADYGPDYIILNINSEDHKEDFKILKEWIMK